jgi:DHA1 family bicyclomycin/chloramphenicol resistance-like MFS transporter
MNQSIAKAMMIATVILMDLLAGMEFDLFVPSFPLLQNHFSLSPFLVEALLSVNFIGYGLSLFFVGTLADSFQKIGIIILFFIFMDHSFFC